MAARFRACRKSTPTIGMIGTAKGHACDGADVAARRRAPGPGRPQGSMPLAPFCCQLIPRLRPGALGMKASGRIARVGESVNGI